MKPPLKMMGKCPEIKKPAHAVSKNSKNSKKKKLFGLFK